MVRNRSDRGPNRWHFSFLFLVLIAAGNLEATNPWVQTFNPIRTLYVSPNGNGDGTQGDPMSLTTAISTSLPGDLYLLTAGTYNGQKNLTRAGTSTNPIVWQADAGAAAIVNGSFDITGGYNWIWGLEIKDPNSNGSSDGIAMHAPGVHAINNIVHDIKGRVGIGAWNNGPGQVVYGNIVYEQVPNSNNPHNMYAQNDFVTQGYKYIVHNMMLDAWDATASTYNFHAYTEGNLISGFHAEKNIMRRGKFLIGGTNLPADMEIVKDNYFYDAPAVFGWQIPAQVQFQNNYLGRTYLDTKYFWGAGEVIYPQTAQSVYTGNQIHFPSGNHINFRTAAYLPGFCAGCPEIRSGDSWNSNTYSSPFNASFHADNNNAGTVSFSTWQTVTANAGNAFDSSSTVITSVPDKIAVLANEYETGRGHLAIFNWSLSSTVTVDLSSILSDGSSFQILDPRNMGSPVLTGIYTGPVNIPTSGDEFMALLVLGTGAAPPPDTTPPDTTITSSFCGTTVTTSSVTVTWTGTDDTTATGDLVYAYKLDGGSYSAYTSATSHTFNNLSNGSHTVYVKAKDEAGNVDPTPAQCTFTVSVIDTTPPVISNVVAINIQTNSATITWDTDEASDSQVEYGTTPCPCATNTTLDPSLTTAHSVPLSGLASNTTYHYRAKSRDAAGNLAISSDETFTTDSNPPPPPPPPGQFGYYMEAEATNLTEPMTDKKDNEVSNHKYVESPTQDLGTATFSVEIPVAGTYTFWARVKAPDGDRDSFFVSADGGAEDIYDCAINTSFQWDRVNGRTGGDPRTFSFTVGQHTLTFRGREPGTSLEMILVTDDLGFVPPNSAAVPELYKIKAKKITNSSAKIKWRSEMLANSLVEYGTTVLYGSVTTLDSEMVEKHKVPLENLQPNTLYHYRVTSLDEGGNQWVSADFSFTTLP